MGSDMADEADTTSETPKASGSKPLIFGIVLMLIAGAGAFYALRSGMILGESEPAQQGQVVLDPALPELAFIPIEPLVVSIGGAGPERHLRFAGQLEVDKAHLPEVQLIMPRVIDVLNTYLRAVDSKTFEETDSLVRIRAQMLRRIKLVAGENRVRDLLVSEYIIN